MGLLHYEMHYQIISQTHGGKLTNQFLTNPLKGGFSPPEEKRQLRSSQKGLEHPSILAVAKFAIYRPPSTRADKNDVRVRLWSRNVPSISKNMDHWESPSPVWMEIGLKSPISSFQQLCLGNQTFHPGPGETERATA